MVAIWRWFSSGATGSSISRISALGIEALRVADGPIILRPCDAISRPRPPMVARFSTQAGDSGLVFGQARSTHRLDRALRLMDGLVRSEACRCRRYRLRLGVGGAGGCPQGHGCVEVFANGGQGADYRAGETCSACGE